VSDYSTKFFQTIRQGSYTSAEAILSILGRHAKFTSFLDVGCGPGSWMDAAGQVLSIAPERMLGIDGQYSAVMHAQKAGRFQYQDLAQPLSIQEKFDLLVCVEVAEHLPASRAAALVETFCATADVIIFAAAIPGQGGTGHINEQWPAYWLTKFMAHGFGAFDLFRPLLWNAAGVAPWYAQNCFLFVRKHHPLESLLQASAITGLDDWRLRLVHPGVFQQAACESAGASRVARALPRSLLRSLARRLPKFQAKR
jgi:SAM-dependent methyltransferase